MLQVARIIAAHDEDAEQQLDFGAIPSCVRLKLDERVAAGIFTAAGEEIRALAETLRAA